jgi:hypothetical protein
MICCEPALDLSEPALIDIMGHQIILTLPGTLSIKNNSPFAHFFWDRLTT